MILNALIPSTIWPSILHVCGDDPVITCIICQIISYSPRMWRWSYPQDLLHLHQDVFSTYVEMILFYQMLLKVLGGILHVCGDDPFSSGIVFGGGEYSPRMWRWSLISCITSFKHVVFSTYVEMILLVLGIVLTWSRILHVCGDDPMLFLIFKSCHPYSPRMWRWFLVLLVDELRHTVFSTYVEMILKKFQPALRTRSILHVCGDDLSLAEKWGKN